eukprot:CAMPEP_0170516974 /NCGR_PEP_ID=MMETSP0209-20121228/3079_1 /TAXON_ID=665100 ORGANISM="Litonotus pictus, Strain P1" /NCGR_SAMPLE_ID=MMETSP0209 /ASSEMBLY_ACC=CAM_ASM_000301 /LENGTH=334 /DNA_ID=CAMNT_0010802079 /DNA_START=386 /DNA_END=1386 /DNA_ORIENTATION=+
MNVQNKIKSLQQYKVNASKVDYHEEAENIKATEKAMSSLSVLAQAILEPDRDSEVRDLQDELSDTFNEVEYINEKVSLTLSSEKSNSMSNVEVFFYQLFNLENKVNQFSAKFDKMKSSETINKKASEIIQRLSSQVADAVNQLSVLSGAMINRDTRDSRDSRRKYTKSSTKESSKERNRNVLRGLQGDDSERSEVKKGSLNRNQQSQRKLSNIGEEEVDHYSSGDAGEREDRVVLGKKRISKIKSYEKKQPDSVLRDIKIGFFSEFSQGIVPSSKSKGILSVEELRIGIIGRNSLYHTPFGEVVSLYADDTASARPHAIIENYISAMLPVYANT